MNDLAVSAAVDVTGAVGGAGFAAAQITMTASSSASRIDGYVAINAGGNEAAGAVANGGVNGTTLIRSGVMGASVGYGLIS